MTNFSFARFCRALVGLATLGMIVFAANLPGETPASTQPDAPKSALGPIEKKKFNLGPWENDIGYAQAVRVGNTLYISGSVGGGEMPNAIQQAFDTVARTLAAHRLGFQHVVKENIFTTDLEALKAHKDLRKAYYQGDYPAATWVQVARLYNSQYLVEVEVIAVFPDGS